MNVSALVQVNVRMVVNAIVKLAVIASIKNKFRKESSGT